MKKIINISLVLMICTLVLTGCGNKTDKTNNTTKKDSEIQVNTNQDVIKDQEVEGIKMTNTSMTTKDGVTTFQTTVTNNTGSDYKLNEYNILVKDKDGNVIKTIPGYVGSTIKNGESKTLKSTTNADLTGAVSVEYEVSK